MLPLSPPLKPGQTLRVLALGAHCDDIEIGCGGTLLALQRQFRRVRISSLTLVSPPQRQKETLRALRKLVSPAARGTFRFEALRDGHLPADYTAVKQFIESAKASERPDLVLCHERADWHQDHRLVNEIAWSTFRDQIVLEYEIPKWDGGLTTPNLYVPLTPAQVQRKIRALMTAHQSQLHRDWFTEDTFKSLLRLRGLECRAASGYAEAFHARKLTWSVR